MKTKENNICRTEEQSIAAQKLEIHAPRNSRLLLAPLRHAQFRKPPDALLHPSEIDPRERCPAGHSPSPSRIPEQRHRRRARDSRANRNVLDAALGGSVESLIPPH